MAGNIENIETVPAFVIFDEMDLGFTSTPIELVIEGLNKEVVVDQFGEEVIALINQGNNVSIRATFKETIEEFKKKIYGAAGLMSEFTDDEAEGPVLGIGSANVGTNLATLAKLIKIIPLNDAQKDQSLIGWKATPVPGSLKYSGTEENEVEVEFKLLDDKTKPSAISKCAIGDPDNLPTYAAIINPEPAPAP